MRTPLLALLFVVAVTLTLGCEPDREVRKMGSEVMQPTISPGSEITIDYGAYRESAPLRGHIVAYQNPGAPEGWLGIGRVVGIGGDTLRVEEGELYVNDMTGPLDEPYIAEPMAYELDKVSVPDDHVFVLADNRNGAFDSHHFGSLPSENVVGRVTDIDDS